MVMHKHKEGHVVPGTVNLTSSYLDVGSVSGDETAIPLPNPLGGMGWKSGRFVCYDQEGAE